MTAIADRPAAIEVRLDHVGSVQTLSLRATGDGWSLLAPDGEVVFRGFGLAGRRQCLQFARRLGVLAVLS
jgi:hypothetical protein